MKSRFVKMLIAFFKKNWILITIIFVALISFGIIGRLIAKIRVWFSVATNSTPAKDYDLYAGVMHDALKTSIFDWFVNFEVVKNVINGLESTNEFLELSKRYALKFGIDLRSELQKDLSKGQYEQLLWK